jgi:hypothetical protein
MNKIKAWLYNKFLPAYCKDDLISVNQHLTGVILEQKQEIDRLNAYINGMETAIRFRNRITINNGVNR